jgi:hypothetical protein
MRSSWLLRAGLVRIVIWLVAEHRSSAWLDRSASGSPRLRLSTTKLGPCHRDRDDRGRLQPTPDALDSYDISGPFVVELIGVCDVERYQRSRLDPLGVVSCHPGVPDLGQADGLTTEKNAYPVENRTGRLRGGAA